MARTFNEDEYAVRRKEILDVGQRLIYTRGYEQMTIQDILDALQISKGAFYHYFGSKQVLLEAVVERMLDEAINVINPIVEEPRLPALEKLQCYFNIAGRWKTERKEFMLALLRVWYNDDNIVVRQKVYDAGIRRLTPAFDKIIRPGVTEGVFSPAYPDEAGAVILSMFTSFGDVITQILMNIQDREADLRRLMIKIGAFNDAMERILGVPPGSLSLIEEQTMREWVVVKG
jgi:AcrR family transcriptional regulator